jgi:hypothetical protein
MIAFVTFNTYSKFFDGKKIHYLSENRISLVHWALPSVTGFDPKGIPTRSGQFQIDPINIYHNHV